MLSEKTIRKAYKNLRKGKTRRAEVKYIDAHLDDEVQKMHDMILNTKPDGIEVQNPKLGFKPHKHTPKIIYEHGKIRKIFEPEIHEQWLHHIIVLVLEPIITGTAYKYSCGSFPKRGAHYAKRRIEKWLRSDPKGTRNFLKVDIRHFYDSIRLDVLMRELAIRIKDEWFLHVIWLCLREFKKGIPLGFYISQWLANYLLEPLDKLITETLGLDKLVRYMGRRDDLRSGQESPAQCRRSDPQTAGAAVPFEAEEEPAGLQSSIRASGKQWADLWILWALYFTGTRPSFASGSCSRPHRRPGTSTRRKRQGVATATTTSQPC